MKFGSFRCSKKLSNRKVFQYHGSKIIYLILRLISRLYVAPFSSDYVVVPSPYGRLYLPKEGRTSYARIVTYMVDMVEPQWASYFEQLIKQLNEGFFVDVGAAADGWYSIKACKMNSKLSIIAVEPSSYEYKYLLANLASNGCLKRTLPTKVGLSDHNGVMDLNGEEVRCMRLDDLLPALRVALNAVKVLKIDVEGAGLKVLKGALQTIQDRKPTIFLEVHDKEEAEAKTFLKALDYKVMILPGSMYVAISNFHIFGREL